jgi:hypothetical protein
VKNNALIEAFGLYDVSLEDIDNNNGIDRHQFYYLCP